MQVEGWQDQLLVLQSAGWQQDCLTVDLVIFLAVGEAMGIATKKMPVNRYEAAQSARIAELETEVKLRDANSYTNGLLNNFRNYVDAKFASVEKEICDQKTYNAVNTATLNCISGQVAQLMSLTKMVIPIASICPTPAVATTTTTP
jgi:hypothetical protein